MREYYTTIKPFYHTHKKPEQQIKPRDFLIKLEKSLDTHKREVITLSSSFSFSLSLSLSSYNLLGVCYFGNSRLHFHTPLDACWCCFYSLSLCLSFFHSIRHAALSLSILRLILLYKFVFFCCLCIFSVDGLIWKLFDLFDMYMTLVQLLIA